MNEYIIPRGFVNLNDLKKSEIENILYKLEEAGYQPLSHSLRLFFRKPKKANWLMINPYFNRCYLLTREWPETLSMDEASPLPMFNDHFDIEKLNGFSNSQNQGRIHDVHHEECPMKFSMEGFAVGCTWFSFEDFGAIRDAYEEYKEKYYDRKFSLVGAIFGVSKKREVPLYKLDINELLTFDEMVMEIDFKFDNLTFRRTLYSDQEHTLSIDKFRTIKERISAIREYNKYFKNNL